MTAPNDKTTRDHVETPEEMLARGLSEIERGLAMLKKALEVPA